MKQLTILLPLLVLSSLLFGQPGFIDLTFNESSEGFNQSVQKILVQADDKIIVSGAFTAYNGVSVNYLCRLLPDGSLDTSFYNQFPLVQAPKFIFTKSDGTIIIADSNPKSNADASNYIVRLLQDGSVDSSYYFTRTNLLPLKKGIQAMTIDADGYIILGYEEVKYYLLKVVRINSNGVIENTGYLNTNPEDGIEMKTIKAQSDGKLIAVGTFDLRANYELFKKISRLNADLSPDDDFYAYYDFPSDISAIDIQNDDKILILGSAFDLDGEETKILRLLPDGRHDPTFQFEAKNHAIDENLDVVIAQPDHKVVIASSNLEKLIRLLPDGQVDSSFNTSHRMDGIVRTLALQSDGKILVGGDFTTFNDKKQNRILRLQNCIDGVRIDNHTACTSFTWIDGITYTQSDPSLGRYVFEEKSVNGCDSVAVLNLKIHGDLNPSVLPPPNFIADAEGYLVAKEIDVLYQWIDCNTGLPIEGATSRVFWTSKSGSYAVIITSPYCDDLSIKSECTEVLVNTHDSQTLPLMLYPNPTTDVVYLEGITENIQSIAVHAISGQLLQSHHGSIAEVNLSGLADGLYFLTIQYGDAIETRKIALKKD
ncbi:MAG: T9SS type A sorting domain-containing protein [Chitinophagales bacterium]|nr:T9SS type A sorting domain-containing protein [Chitinophagales bacterium]